MSGARVQRELRRCHGFLKNRFKDDVGSRPRLDGVSFKRIKEGDRRALVDHFTLEEIREAVWDCEGSKSPGPDVFNFNFIKNNGEILKDDVRRMMMDFHSRGIIPRK